MRADATIPERRVSAARMSVRRSGSAVIEIALLAPWIFFVFIGVMNYGFVIFGLLSTQNAARAAAMYASRSASYAALPGGTGRVCQIVLGEMRSVINTNALTVCNVLPLQVVTAVVAGADGLPASEVSVTYRTPTLVPIPGVLPSQVTITRRAQMRIDPSF